MGKPRPNRRGLECPVWTAGQERILGRYTRRVLDGSIRSAMQAAGPCHRALSRLKDWPGRTELAVYMRLCDRLRQSGRRRVVSRWTRSERRVIDRYVRALQQGKLPSVRKAGPLLLRDLQALPARLRADPPRTLAGVTGRLLQLSRKSGVPHTRADWTPEETRVLDRFARKLGQGRYRNMTEATPECLRELAQLRQRIVRENPNHVLADIERSPAAVNARLNLRARRFTGGPRFVAWTPPEDRIVDRFVRAIVRKTYSGAAAAAPDCQRALVRKAGTRRAVDAVRTRLHDRSRTLGFDLPSRDWLNAERRIVEHYARNAAAGRFHFVIDAARICFREMRLQRREHPERFAGTRPRSLQSVHRVMLAEVTKLGYPFFRSHWTAEEQRLLVRYAQAAVDHKYPSILHAARACTRHINRTLTRKPGRKARAPVRPLCSVYGHLVQQVEELGRNRVGFRRWTPTEERVAEKWTRKYDLHRQGKLRMNLQTVSELMQAELDRKGYFRTVDACEARVLLHCNAMLRAG